MSRRVHLYLLLTLLVFIVGIAPGQAAAAERNSYIVVLEDSVQEPAGIAWSQVKARGGELGFIYRHAIKGYSAELPAAAIGGLQRDPHVKYVVADRRVSLAEEEEEVELETENHEGVEALEAIVPTGISRTFAASNKALDMDGQDDTGADVDVAVLDTGIVSHADLRVFARLDCTQGGPSCLSNSGAGESHGTHVAGTIGALDNGFGVVGMAPGARLWSIKVLQNGKGQWSWVIAGADWLAAHSSEIEVANMSVGGSGTFLALNEALQSATEGGVVVVAAAGNNGGLTTFFSPANFKPILTVSALADYDGLPGGKSPYTCADRGLDDHSAIFSNHGSGIDITAPGVCILSTDISGSYSEKSGTSMAAPHVAGAAAILAAKNNPDSTSDVQAVQSTLIATGNLGWTDTSGDGVKERLLDVHREDVYSLVAAPTVATGPVDFHGVGDGAETFLTGSVNPNGLSTSYQFEYVSAAQYKPEAENPYAEGSKVPVSPASIGSGSEGNPIEVSQLLTGLKAGTTYHYRLVAENAEGTAAGRDRTFVSRDACKGAEEKCAWSLQSVPNPVADTISDLEDVSCASATSCIAVGADHYVGKGITRSWNGSEWKATNTLNAELKAVSCPTTTWCVTIAQGENKSWQLKQVEGFSFATLKSPPTPEGATEVRLNDVSCTSESACTIVGRYYAGAYKPYVARWNGSSWSLQTAPGPSEGNAGEAMLGVSCSSASHCVSVGKAAGKPFVERWNGSEWTVQSAPAPSGATETTLQSVSCTSESACMAVGYFKNGGLYPKAVAERWNGSSWSVLASPAPPKEGHVWLRSVSCVSASSCVAAGGYATPFLATGETTLVHAWNGTEWSAQSSPSPEGKAFSGLAGVSCSSASACTAVGQAGPGWSDVAGTVTLAERFN